MSRYDRYSARSRELLLAMQELVVRDGRGEIGLDDLNTALLLGGLPELQKIARSNNAVLDRERLERLYGELRSRGPAPVPSAEPAALPAALPAASADTAASPTAIANADAASPPTAIADAAPAALPASQPAANPAVMTEAAQSIAQGVDTGPGAGAAETPPIKLSPEFRSILDEAEKLSGADEVEVMHILRAAWPRVGDKLGPYFDGAESLELPLPSPAPGGEPERLPALEALGRELGDKDEPRRVFAREKEIDKLVSVLIKYWKPNPLLIGEPGVGKTALVEGLAERIARGEVPEPLRGARVFEIRVSDIAAGTAAHGSLEERLKELIDTVEANPDVIVFLDEVHQISAGYTNDPVADILKPALARGLFRCIGATTISDYHRYLAKEDALLRRFQVVPVDEPSGEAMDAILAGLKGELEAHFGLEIPHSSLAAAKALSERYLPQRFQPDKALDVLDRACALAVMEGKEALGPAEIERAAMDSAGIREGGAVDPSDPAALAAALGKRILGQDEALERIALCLARSRTRRGRGKRRKPAGILLLAGPPGTGKTECAEALGSILSGRDEGSMRIDLSEFSEPHTIARLIGAPPGYIGYGDIPLLPHALERNPAGVLALDQFDKAHPQVQRLFQQLFESGRVSDSYGRPLDFSSMSVVLTCTVDAGKGRSIGFGGGAAGGQAQAEAAEAAKRLLGQEIAGRLDEVVAFRPFDLGGLKLALERRFLGDLNAELAEEGLPALDLDAALSEQLCAEALKSGQGARALGRSFQERIAAPFRAWVLGPGILGAGAREAVAAMGATGPEFRWK